MFRNNPILAEVFIALGALILFIPFLGGVHLFDWDEINFAESAREMILTGDVINAREAHRIGLVNKVVPPQELLAVVMDMAKEIASKGPIALRYAKEAVHKGMDLTLEQGLRLEADLYFLLHTTRDRTEGIRDYQEKRSPQFEGR